ncbi:MAG: NAD(P)H-hydrate dehydratase [Propionibacteriaceae bacterium]|jgi:hydroxyethylthiazole kinase-like uncharacterized protein yjeF|nr:NAD(P)H-hydrate dehydratase [Propionibacteriaceae bacterium]
MQFISLMDLAQMWPRPWPEDDKYSRGVVGIDTGSARYPGAAVLSVLGALNAGAGFIRFIGAEEARPALLVRAPSITYGPGPVNALVIGCGWDDSPDALATSQARLDAALATGAPLVIDATALRLLPALMKRSPTTTELLPPDSLLTPHAGELAHLLDVSRATVEHDPEEAARQAAKRFGAVVLLKGAYQYVASPGHDHVKLAAAGPAWTAQAGSGDVLAGICGALLASGLGPYLAALAGASIQAMTASEHLGPWPPDRLVEFLPETIARLTSPDDPEFPIEPEYPFFAPPGQ